MLVHVQFKTRPTPIALLVSISVIVNIKPLLVFPPSLSIRRSQLLNNMTSFKFMLAVMAATIWMVNAEHSAVDVLQDMYNVCLKEFSIGCVKPKALSWLSGVVNDPVIKITEDLMVVKKQNPEENEVKRGVIVVPILSRGFASRNNVNLRISSTRLKISYSLTI